jgi:hypothetical protein
MTNKKQESIPSLFSEEATDNSSDGIEMPQAEATDTIVENKEEDKSTVHISQETKSIIVVSPEEMPILAKFSEEEQKVLEVVAICERAQQINDDTQNDYARQVGKRANELLKAIDKKRLALTEPIREQHNRINAVAKKLSSPIDLELEKLRQSITTYETEKERKRQMELKRIEEEKKAKEEIERKERERVAKIKLEINNIQNNATADINRIEDLKGLTEFDTRLRSWKPKAEFFAEFMPELKSMLEDLYRKIELRKPIIEELTKQKEEAQRLKGEAKKVAEEKARLEQEKLDKAKKDEADRLQIEKEARDRAEVLNRQDLSIFIASLNYTKETLQETEKFIGKYGSATAAIANKQGIIDAINAERLAKAKDNELEAKKMKNQRVNFKFRILNESQVPREYLMVDEKKLNEAIVKNRILLEKIPAEFKIDGIEIYSETKTVFK